MALVSTDSQEKELSNSKIFSCRKWPKHIKKVQLLLKENNIDFFVLGQTNSSSNLNLKDITTISINDIKNLNEKTIPSMMGDQQQG